MPDFAIVDEATFNQSIYSPIREMFAVSEEDAIKAHDEYRKNNKDSKIRPVLAQRFGSEWRIVFG